VVGWGTEVEELAVEEEEEELVVEEEEEEPVVEEEEDEEPVPLTKYFFRMGR
jgi:hypothetical protein